MVTVRALPHHASYPSYQTVKKKAQAFVLSVLIRFGWISNLLLFPGIIRGLKEETLQQD